MHRFRHAHQYRSNGHPFRTGDAQQVIADTRRFDVRHDQHVGRAFQRAVRHPLVTNALHQRGVAVHLSVDHQLRRALAHQLQGLAHFARGRRFGGAKVGVRQ